jgi:RNA polymerase sigma-70 factor (ECF subfamily)
MAKPATEDDIRVTYQATIDALFGFVVRRTDGDRDLAEDIVQESWLRAVKAWHAEGLPENPGAWLTTVSRHLLANHFRRRPLERFDEDTPEPVLEAGTGAGELQDSLLARAMARLTAAQSRLLHAFHFERQPVARIAAAQGLSERAVEGRLRRARQQLRHELESNPDSEGESP